MIIFTNFDSSTKNAPAGFFTAVNAAVEFWEREIINPIQLTITFGWGQVAGQPLGKGALGESQSQGFIFTYSQVKTALTSHAVSPNQVTASHSLPASYPVANAQFFVPYPEALVLGLTGAQAANVVEGSIGMSSTDPFTFNPFNRAVAGNFDAIGVMEHEVSEVLGRIAGGGVMQNNVAQYSPLDLFRYSGAGQLVTTPGGGSFSINGGNTLLQAFNDPSGGNDAGDWGPGVIGDAFGEGMMGHSQLVSALDLELMNVLGFQLAPDAFARNDFNADGKSGFLIENTSGSVVVGEDTNGKAALSLVGGLGSEWKFVANGDFLGSGSDQFLIQNSSGAIVDGQEQAGGKEMLTQISGLGSEWKFVGVGDFLGLADGDQFLIENTHGAVVIGNSILGTTAYTQIGGLGPEWKFVGAGNFLGTGPSEFLIENTSGAVVLGQVQNNKFVLTQVSGLGSEWKFVGDGDFLNDGKDQFLIENTNGAVVVGEINNNKVTYTQIASLGSEWKFVGTGDYAGEGHDSFLIENTSGAVVIGDWSGGHIHFTQIGALGPEWAFH
ncbi:MAG TPA: NF038122 family metalloprotease [Caulobacteraceae bacterium]|jgi:hypothetical protein